MFNNHRVVVSMTSWTKRIKNCCPIIKSILGNTLKPDLIFLNLSIAEFPKREDSLPQELVQMTMTHPEFKIFWVPGPNVKPWKKVFPILKYLNDDDLIILIDDDLQVQNNLVECRVKEFLEYGGRFAIMGGRQYAKTHLNIPIFNFGAYNTICPTSILQKKMLNGFEKILDREVLDTYHDDCIYSMMCLINGYQILPAKKLTIVRPKSLDVNGMHKLGMCKTDKEVIELFAKKCQAKTGKTLKQHLFNLVIWDSFNLAGDNGEYFYRKVRELFPNIRLTFLLQKGCGDWNRLKADGFNLFPIDDPDIEFILKQASFICFSKEIPMRYTLRSVIAKYRSKTMFLQHGVTNDANDVSFYLGGIVSRMAKYCCCTSDGECGIVKKFSGNRFVPVTVGFPRWDSLMEKNERRKRENRSQKAIFITFHWRRFLSEKTIGESKYLADINRLLNSQQIMELRSSGVKIRFLPHARFMKFMPLFKVPKFVEVPINRPFQDILVESDVLITDFSSNRFEMAYMDKPSVVYVPGNKKENGELKQYHLENIKKCGNFNYCDSLEKVFQTIKKVLDGNSHIDLAHKLFKYVDMDNGKRLMEWILKTVG